MGFLWVVLATFAELGAISGLLFLIWTTHYYLSHENTPHGICQPYKVKFAYYLLVWIMSVDYVFWKLGFWRRYALIDVLMTVFSVPLPWKKTKLSIKDLHTQGVPVRLYQPKGAHTARKGIILIHGGGGSMGNIASYERICRHIAHETNSVVLSVGYSLPRQRPYPAQFQECLDVTIHFINHAKDYGVDPACVTIMGDSFGGLLAASVCQMMVQRNNVPKLRAQILIYPCLQFITFSLPSYLQNASAPPLMRTQVLAFALQYLQKDKPLVDAVVDGCLYSKEHKMKYEKWLSPDNIPEEFKVREKKAPLPSIPFGEVSAFIDLMRETIINPLIAEDTIIQQVPEMFLLSAQYDVLRDDGILYKKRLEDNNVPVSWCHLEDGFHGALSLYNDPFLETSCTKRGMDSVVNFIKNL